MVSQNNQAIMNYMNYDMNVKQKYRCKLVGWTYHKICSPFDIHTISDIRVLLDALRSGKCHWVRMGQSELTKHAKEVEAKEAAGEVVGKKRKGRSDSGLKRGPNKKKKKTVDAEGSGSPQKHKQKKKGLPADAARKAAAQKAVAQLPPMRSRSVVNSDSDAE